MRIQRLNTLDRLVRLTPSGMVWDPCRWTSEGWVRSSEMSEEQKRQLEEELKSKAEARRKKAGPQ